MTIFISDNIDEKCLNLFINKSIKNKSKYYIVKTNRKTFVESNISLSKFFLKNVFKIKNFISKFSLPAGRLQYIKINNNDCYLDVSHNLQGFVETFKYFEKHKITFDQIVVSLSNDKNDKLIFDFLDKQGIKIYVYENKGRKPKMFYTYSNKYSKIMNLKNFILTLNKKTLFIGSFYLISEILTYL